jgi:hypothetical protein
MSCMRFVCYRHAHEPDDGVVYCLGMHLVASETVLRPVNPHIADLADRAPDLWNPTRSRFKPLRAPGEGRRSRK